MPRPWTRGVDGDALHEAPLAAAAEHGVADDASSVAGRHPHPVGRRGPAGVDDAVDAEAPERGERGGVDGGHGRPLGAPDAPEQSDRVRRAAGTVVERALEQVEPRQRAPARRRANGGPLALGRGRR